MPNHRFSVGERIVVPFMGRAAGVMPSGMYIVVRLLPPVSGEPHYRARSTHDGREWALVESQMRPAAADAR
jgi:hypothetical protein